jgi:hypothetical protein
MQTLVVMRICRLWNIKYQLIGDLKSDEGKQDIQL